METEEIVEAPADAHDKLLTLQYDFLKHLTSLSLLSIGGTVTFAGSIFAKVTDKQTLWIATGGLAIAAILAFLGQLQLLSDLRLSGRAIPLWKKWLVGQSGLPPSQSISIATFFLALSVGALIAFAIEHLQ